MFQTLAANVWNRCGQANAWAIGPPNSHHKFFLDRQPLPGIPGNRLSEFLEAEVRDGRELEPASGWTFYTPWIWLLEVCFFFVCVGEGMSFFLARIWNVAWRATNAPRQKHKAWSFVYFGGKDMEIELSGKQFHDIFFLLADVLPFSGLSFCWRMFCCWFPG